VPTARWGVFSDIEDAVAFADDLGGAAAIKADGLAGGKGVVVTNDLAASRDAITDLMSGRLGEAGARVVVEERLEGPEMSLIALSDGERLALLAPSRDHKRVGDGDTGPNTGGMGAYAPAPDGTVELLMAAESLCIRPVIEALMRRGALFSGILYAGLMLTESGPKVLEYNVRLGDPETQVLLPILDEDAYELFWSMATGRLQPRPLRLTGRTATTVVLAAEGYPGRPRGGDQIHGLEEASAMSDVRVYHAGARREGDAVVTSGGRVLGVTGIGANLEAATARAYEAVSKISFDGMHFRRDIAARRLA
jgi:phosphoribosylamine---glycine ligase